VFIHENTTIIQTYLGLLVGGDIIRNAVLKWNKLDPAKGAEG
jgi:hypothetical protein